MRALETAYLLDDIGNWEWKPNHNIRERDYGLMDAIPYPEELEQYLEWQKRRRENRLFWSPPGGESILRVMFRVDRIFQTLNRHHAEDNIVIVAHGELILAAILEICRIYPTEFGQRKDEHDPLLTLDNCQIVEFTREDPETGRMSDHLDWVRSVCPWKTEEPAPACAVWQKIKRPKYSLSELRRQVEEHPWYLSEK